MKKTLKSLVAIACCAFISSCAIYTNPITATTNPLGSKCGESKNITILGLWSPKSAENAGINEAAKNAGIKKISHVDSYTKSYFLGIVEQQVTKVYGE